MKKYEMRRALGRHNMNYESFAMLVGKTRPTVCRYGADGGDVPQWVKLVVTLIEERGGADDLFRRMM